LQSTQRAAQPARRILSFDQLRSELKTPPVESWPQNSGLFGFLCTCSLLFGTPAPRKRHNSLHSQLHCQLHSQLHGAASGTGAEGPHSSVGKRRSSGVAAKAFQPAPAAGVQLRSPQAAPPRTPHADRRVKLPHQAAGGGKKRTRRSLAGSAVLDSPPFQTSDGFGRSTIGARFVLCISSITTRWRPPCPAPADARRAPPCAAGRPFHRGASAPPSDRGP